MTSEQSVSSSAILWLNYVCYRDTRDLLVPESHVSIVVNIQFRVSRVVSINYPVYNSYQHSIIYLNRTSRF